MYFVNDSFTATANYACMCVHAGERMCASARAPGSLNAVVRYMLC